jgi:hypothetical protein
MPTMLYFLHKHLIQNTIICFYFTPLQVLLSLTDSDLAALDLHHPLLRRKVHLAIEDYRNLESR